MNKINRKGFFDNIAKEHLFDPLSAENWYKISPDTIKARKVCEMLLFTY